jgi:hypothetical protein
MKTKKYFLLVISFLLVVSILYLSTNSIITAPLLDDLEQKTSSKPQLSQTVAWDDNGTIICNATEGQYNPQICSDGDGGAIITWYDWRNGEYDIYAQKIDSAGNPQWNENGNVICNATAFQLDPKICCDGSGGAIITWEDERNGNDDIYAQRIDSAGNIQWGDTFWSGPGDLNGTVICNTTQDQRSFQICSDGDKGAIITWEDSRNGNGDIYAQRIDSAGILQWTVDGTVICNETTQQWSPQICSDGNIGAIITYGDYRNGNYDIYAQKIDSTGDTKWSDGSYWGGFQDRNGTAICNATYDQNLARICCDGTGGAIITWIDYRDGNVDVYAQRVDSAGNIQWGESLWSGPGDLNGTVICNAKNDQSYAEICNITGGGAIITWIDKRSDDKGDIYVQKIDSGGNSQWGNGSFWGGLPDRNGTVICNAKESQINQNICCDGTGGAIITWEDYRSDASGDIYAQEIDSTGKTQWGNGTMWGSLQDRNGTIICNAIDIQLSPQICYDGESGAIITWYDWRNDPTSQRDIYAQKIKGVSGGSAPSSGGGDGDDDDDDDDKAAIPGYPLIILIGIMGLMVLYLRKRFQKRLKSVK